MQTTTHATEAARADTARNAEMLRQLHAWVAYFVDGTDTSEELEDLHNVADEALRTDNAHLAGVVDLALKVERAWLNGAATADEDAARA